MPQEIYLFRLETDPPAYLWSGVGDIVIPGDALVGPDSTTYRGIGTLGGIPALQNLINGVADRADYTLSGVDPIAMQYVEDDKQSIPGSLIRIGSIPIGDDGQPIMPVDWEWEGIADTISLESQSQQEGARTRSITVSAGTANIARSTSGASYFTDADQRKISPTDTYFSYVGGIYGGTTRRFGVRS